MGTHRGHPRSNPKHGQVMLEVAALVIVVAAALAAMLLPLKRAVAGRLESAAVSISGGQYAPKHTTGTTTLKLSGTTTTSSILQKNQPLPQCPPGQTPPCAADVLVTQSTIDPNAPETSVRTGDETVEELAHESLWD